MVVVSTHLFFMTHPSLPSLGLLMVSHTMHIMYAGVQCMFCQCMCTHVHFVLGELFAVGAFNTLRLCDRMGVSTINNKTVTHVQPFYCP